MSGIGGVLSSLAGGGKNPLMDLLKNVAGPVGDAVGVAASFTPAGMALEAGAGLLKSATSTSSENSKAPDETKASSVDGSFGY